MSREDLVFTKRALVVVAVLSTLGSVLLVGATVAWRASVAIGEIRAEASKAVAEVREAVRVVEIAEARHEEKDDQRQKDLEGRVSRLEDHRERVDERLSAWGLPVDRRRPRVTPAAVTDGG